MNDVEVLVTIITLYVWIGLADIFHFNIRTSKKYLIKLILYNIMYMYTYILPSIAMFTGDNSKKKIWD